LPRVEADHKHSLAVSDEVIATKCKGAVGFSFIIMQDLFEEWGSSDITKNTVRIAYILT